MSNYSELCTASGDLLGTGRGTCAKSLGPDIRFFLSTSAFTGTAAQLKTQAYWEAAIVAETVIPFPEVMEIEPQNVEAAYYESPSGSTFKMKNEKRKTMYKFIENIVTHSGMKSYSDRSWKIWFYTKNGFLRGHTVSADLYEGLDVSNFFVNAQETPTYDAVEQTPVVVEFTDADDWDKEFVVLQPSFNMMDLEGVFDTILTIGSISTGATLVVPTTVTIKGSNAVVAGLAKEQFILLDGSGNVLSISSATESPSGTYAVTATTAVITGTVQLSAVVTVSSTYYQSDATTYA